MPFQSAPDIAQATAYLMHDAQQIVHSMYFKSTDGWSGGEIIQLAQVFGDAWEEFMMPLYPDSVTLTHVVATDQESLEGARSVYSFAVPVAGGVASPALPNNVAFAVQLSTGNRGRGKQGRLFIGPLAESQAVADQVTAAHAGALVVAIGAVGNAVEATIDLEATWVVLSRVLNNAPRALAEGLPVTAPTYTNLYLDSQKNRLPFHKRRRAPTP